MNAVKNPLVIIFYKTYSLILGYVNAVILNYDTAILSCLGYKGVLIPSGIQAVGIS